MATTDFDFKNTRDEIIQSAYRKIGVLSEGETLDGSQQVVGQDNLNQIIKSWQNEGIFLWSLEWLTVNLVASTASYTLSTDPAVIGIDRGYLRDSASEDHYIEQISWREYNELPDKTDTGQPYKFAVDHQEAMKVYFWPVPDATFAAWDFYYLGITKLQDWEAAAGNGDLPIKFQKALIYQLATDLADDYGIPLNERGYLASKASELFYRAKAADRERADYEFVEGAF